MSAPLVTGNASAPLYNVCSTFFWEDNSLKVGEDNSLKVGQTFLSAVQQPVRARCDAPVWNGPMRPILSLLLIAGFVWQVGAYPCGCLEHNGWDELFHHEQNPDGQSSAASALADHSSLVAGDHESHSGTGSHRFIVPRKEPLRRLTRAVGDPAMTNVCGRSTECSAECAGFFHGLRSSGSRSALSRRATLQVYLI